MEVFDKQLTTISTTTNKYLIRREYQEKLGGFLYVFVSINYQTSRTKAIIFTPLRNSIQNHNGKLDELAEVLIAEIK